MRNVSWINFLRQKKDGKRREIFIFHTQHSVSLDVHISLLGKYTRRWREYGVLVIYWGIHPLALWVVASSSNSAKKKWEFYSNSLAHVTLQQIKSLWIEPSQMKLINHFSNKVQVLCAKKYIKQIKMRKTNREKRREFLSTTIIFLFFGKMALKLCVALEYKWEAKNINWQYRIFPKRKTIMCSHPAEEFINVTTNNNRRMGWMEGKKKRKNKQHKTRAIVFDWSSCPIFSVLLCFMHAKRRYLWFRFPYPSITISRMGINVCVCRKTGASWTWRILRCFFFLSLHYR